MRHITRSVIVALVLSCCLAWHGWAQAPSNQAAEDSVRALEEARGQALMRGDTVAISRMTAAEFNELTRFGTVRTRAENLRDVSSGMLRLTSVRFDSLTVRIYGDVAILQGITDNGGTMGGVPFTGRIRYTRASVRRDGRWQAVTMQHTRCDDGGGPAILPARSPEDGTTMTSSQLRELLDRYVDEVWAKQNLAVLDQFLAPTYRRHLGRGTDPLTRDGQRRLLAVFRTAFPDARLTVEDVVVEGNLIAFRSCLRGTHRGSFGEIPATERSIEVRLLDMIRVENGMFVEQWGGPDLLDLLQQLGASVSVPDHGTE